MKAHESLQRANAMARTAACCGVTALAALLGACGSTNPPTHFHTLMPPATALAVAEPKASRIDWQLRPVKVPAQADQPQWVLRVADGSVVMLEQERWIAPLADEIHAALVDRLTKSLGPPAAGPAAAGSATSWRMTVDVRRFELVADREARLEADWWIRHGDTNVGCHSAFVQQPSAPGYAALAAAQQRAVGQLADAMSAALEELIKARPTGC